MAADTPSPAHIAAVQAFVEDFRQRVCQQGWWTNALFVTCTSPKGGGVYRSDSRVYLVGPESGTPPAHAFRRESLRGNEWASLLLPDAIDPALLGGVRGTKPVPNDDGTIQNFLAVHLSRRGDEAAKVGSRWVHRPDVDVPGGYALVDDLSWVCDAVAQLELGIPALP
jgi:hypothetical protein